MLRMRSALFCAAGASVFLSLAFAIGRATTTVSMDGSWWQELSQPARVYVVEGMTDAYESGYIDGARDRSDAVYAVLNPQQSPKSVSSSESQRIQNAANSWVMPRYSKTFGSYVNEITDFYANYPNKTNIGVGALMGCLRDDSPHSCDEIGKR